VTPNARIVFIPLVVSLTSSAGDAVQLRIARMDDEQAHHAHRHLNHLVRVRGIHEYPALLQEDS
jgi:hypothetical protein